MRDQVRMNQKMKLIFSQSQTRESFTNSATSQFNDKNEHSLLRELIQNSLDAAHEAIPTEVNISHITVKHLEIPGLESFATALNAAHEFWAENDATMQIVPKIREALEKQDLNLLIIKDNGVGLNTNRMNDILHDGASRKDPDAAGSYGNGHLTTFKFSDLLYILYIGVSEDDGVLVSGHTILASHQSSEGPKGKDGFLVERILDDIDNGFDFIGEKNFKSQFITDLKSEILTETGTGTGTAVIITAFDDSSSNIDIEFLEKIKRISAVHFFPSIVDKKLKITYRDFDSQEHSIDTMNIANILQSFSDEKRSQGLRGGPRGDRTYDAFLTYAPANRVVVGTSLGDVECYLRTREITRFNINLYRKGMWISQRIKGLEERHFFDYEAFDLIIDVKHEKNPDLHALVRACEGSLHMHLEQRAGREEEWESLQRFWGEFRDNLKGYLVKQSYEDFTPEDFAPFDVPESEHSDNQGRTPIERWDPYRPPPPDDDPEPEPPPGR